MSDEDNDQPEEWPLAEEVAVNLEAIEAHLEEHVGPVTSVLHEIISPIVHLDVLVIAPSSERDCWTFVTSGMSDLPMEVPDGVDPHAYARAELMLSLPSSWLPSPDNRAGGNEFPEFELFQSDNGNAAYYPIGSLKAVARFPHEAKTWLGPGHTVQLTDPPEPIGPNTAMTAFLVNYAFGLPPEASEIKIGHGRTIQLLALYPIHADELIYALHKSSGKLAEKLFASGVTELFDPDRKSVVRRRKWWPL